MRRINLPLILDTFFTGFCAFLLFFTSIRYYTGNAYVALGFAIAAFLLFGSLGFLYISRKQNKKLIISKDEKQKKLLSLHLSLSSDSYISALFSKCLESDENKPTIKGNRIYFDGKVLFFIFKMQPICEDDVAKIIKFKFGGEKIIFCCKTSPEVCSLAENFSIVTRQIDYVYDLLKEKNLLPERYVYEPKKISFWKKLKARFSKKICAPLFWSGLALLFLSYFTFFPIYYIVSGSIMLILSTVALVIN